MNKLLATPARRIALAVSVSLLLHALAMWLPEVHLPEHELQLPPLIAKLEPLPKISAKVTAHKRKARPKPQPVAPPPVAETTSIPASAVAEAIAASSPSPASATVAAESAAASSVAEAAPPESQRPPLPKHARLRFNVYQGQQNFKVGETVHELEVDDGRYTLKASVQTTGVVSVFKSYRMVQTSVGTATETTLKPAAFTEEVSDSSGKKSNRADFDWANHTIRFSNGSEASLPPQSQDILSILYQFPVLREQEETVAINIGTAKKFEQYRFAIVFEEEIETALGKLQTVHFRKQHATHETGLEIWFAQEYRLLPVKVRYLDDTGKITAEAVISDIRVSDE